MFPRASKTTNTHREVASAAADVTGCDRELGVHRLRTRGAGVVGGGGAQGAVEVETGPAVAQGLAQLARTVAV